MSTSIKARGLVTALVALAAIGAALLALFVLGSPAVAGSTDLQVTKTADTNDGACNSDCSLREAIIRSNTSGADAIELPAGTYKLTLKNPTGNPDENFAATGDLDIIRGVTIRSEEGARKTIINANGIDRVFHMPVNPSTPFFLSIFGVKITGGVADAGGGIFHDAQGTTLNLNQSTVSGNRASSQGGGILAQRGPLNVTRSTISGNRASSQGGGIHLGGTPGAGPYTLTNTTVSGNQSTLGGGITTYDPVTITDSTIAFNTAQEAGGLHVGGGPGPYTLKNTIVSNNRSNFDAKNCGSDNIVVSQGNNLEKGTSCGLDQPTDINAGPRLGDLANNGGPTNTRALLAGSPAIDSGGDPFPPTDQRGVARPQGFANDIGAFEKTQSINVVQCPTESNDYECLGTSARDALVGRDGTGDYIKGGEGNDVYNGKGGGDSWEDASLTSSDRYLVTVVDFNTIGIDTLTVQDDGGNSDVLDLSRFYRSTDFEFSDSSPHLYMDGPGNNDIIIYNFFTTDSIDTFKFSDRTLTAQQVRAMFP